MEYRLGCHRDTEYFCPDNNRHKIYRNIHFRLGGIGNVGSVYSSCPSFYIPVLHFLSLSFLSRLPCLSFHLFSFMPSHLSFLSSFIFLLPFSYLLLFSLVHPSYLFFCSSYFHSLFTSLFLSLLCLTSDTCTVAIYKM
jgi:hypothetical protein